MLEGCHSKSSNPDQAGSVAHSIDDYINNSHHWKATQPADQGHTLWTTPPTTLILVMKVVINP